MIKKLWCFVLAALVVCNLQSAVSHATAASPDTNTHYALLDEKGQAVIPDASVLCWALESEIFFLGAGFKPSLLRWQLGHNQVELVQNDLLSSFGNWRLLGDEANTYPRRNAILFSLADGLYALVTKTDEIKRYSIEKNEWEHIGSLLFDKSGNTPLDAEMIKDIARCDDIMLFLMNSAEITVLLQLDLSTGACSILPETRFDAIEPHTPGTLLVNLDGNIHIYDLNTQTLSDVLIAADPLSTAFAYDPIADCLYFVRDGDIYQKKADQPEELIRITEVRNAPLSWDEDDQSVYGNAPIAFIRPLSGGAIAYHTGMLPYEYNYEDLTELLYLVHPQPITEAIETLHVEGTYSSATALYQLTHPGVRVEHCISHSQDAEEESYHFPDVFMCSANARCSHPAHDRDLMDLSASPIIRETVKDYDPKILNEINEEGRIIGLPFSVSLNMLDYDKEKWDEIGLPDPPTTVDELFELIELWDEQYANQYPNQPLLGNGGYFDSRYGVWSAVTEAYITTYDSGIAPVNFDTEEYRALIERIINLPDVKYYEWKVLLRFFMAYSPLSYEFTDLDWKDGYTEYTSIPPLKLSEAQPLHVRSSLGYLCIAKDSQSPELALDYLSFLAAFQCMYQPEISFMMIGGCSGHVQGINATAPFFNLFPLIGMTTQGLITLPHEAPGGFIGSETLDFYREIFSTLDFHIYEHNPAYGSMPQLEDRYPWPADTKARKEVCTVDEFIKNMNE